MLFSGHLYKYMYIVLVQLHVQIDHQKYFGPEMDRSAGRFEVHLVVY